MKLIPQRELRNRISQVLRRVEAGERLRITVDGRPVADLIPVSGARRTYVPRDEVIELLTRAPLDPAFVRDLHGAVGATIEEL
jgi:prevent-host-death family protein